MSQSGTPRWLSAPSSLSMQRRLLRFWAPRQRHQMTSSTSGITFPSHMWSPQHGRWVDVLQNLLSTCLCWSLLAWMVSPWPLPLHLSSPISLAVQFLLIRQSLPQVRVEGEGMKQVELSLKDLTTKFKKHTVTTTLQCTGNRRDMFNDVKKVKGLEWGVGECTFVVKATQRLIAACVIASGATVNICKHSFCGVCKVPLGRQNLLEPGCQTCWLLLAWRQRTWEMSSMCSLRAWTVTSAAHAMAPPSQSQKLSVELMRSC